MEGREATYRNGKINVLLEQMCEEAGVGFKYLWRRFVGKEDMYKIHGLQLSGKDVAVFSKNLLRYVDSGTSCNYLNYIFTGDSQ